MKVWLQACYPGDGLTEARLDRFPFVVGRRSDCDLALPLAFVSRRHCQFTRQDSQVFVQDLESYNGTFVNGRRATTPLPVHDGDEINLGPISFRVVLQRPPIDTSEHELTGTHEERALSPSHY